MPGYVDDKDEILTRLRRIEGQVRGLQRMVDDEQYCIDVLTQISAATSGLKRVAVALLNDHLAHCVTEAVAGSGQVPSDRVAEATAAIDRLLKS
jgi:DNA-binding FrmR family transcriptional regulator